LGAWIEFLQNDQWLRAQLTWVSLYHTLFLFTSAGGRTHSMTAPLLQYYLLQDLVKVISQNGVLAKAPERVTPNDRPIASADSQASCRVPDDCIDSRRYPLFMARKVMREVIEQLKATGEKTS
jgi:hypothetical protein